MEKTDISRAKMEELTGQEIIKRNSYAFGWVRDNKLNLSAGEFGRRF